MVAGSLQIFAATPFPLRELLKIDLWKDRFPAGLVVILFCVELINTDTVGIPLD